MCSYSLINRLGSHAYIFALFLLIFWPAAGVSMSAGVDTPGDNFDQLTEEQARIADDMLAFMDKMERTLFDGTERLNGALELESQDFHLDHGEYLIQVARGPVLQKVGLYTGHSTHPVEGRIEETIWNRYLHMDLHPKTPLVGLVHITMTLQFKTDGTSTVGGNMHLAPAAGNEEDFQFVRDRVDAVFEKHGIDVERYRKARCETSRRDRGLVACAGVSFYRPPLFDASWENYQLVRDTYEAVVESYLDLVNNRKDDPFTEADLAIQDQMRWNWLWDRLFSDPYTTTVVPFELYSMATLPPEVKF